MTISRQRGWSAASTAVLAAALLTLLGGLAVWGVVLTDGVLAGLLVLSGVGWGSWPARWLGGRQRASIQQFCLSAALGLGLLGVLTLALGVSGMLDKRAAWAILTIGWVLGVLRLAVVASRASGSAGSRLDDAGRRLGAGWESWDLLLLAIPAAVVLFACSMPPRLLWSSENFAYDALEYHLQAPREYFDAGRVLFLPHNVYASFPQQMEMLYLLLMHLAGSPLAGAIPSQFLHALCGALAVAAITAWTPPGRPRIVAALLAGTAPWLTITGSLAYVEMGTLLLAAVAGGLLLERLGRNTSGLADTADQGAASWRIVLAAGLCAGLAGGCKYTALVLVGVAAGAGWLLACRLAVRRRLGLGAIFTAGVLAAMSPWLARNAVFTGNPVYPFAYRWFGGTAWSDEQAAQWARGHRVPEAASSPAGRARAVWDEFLGSRHFGAGLMVLAAGGLVGLRPIRGSADGGGRSRRTWACAVWLAVSVVAWATLTHMPGRFLVPAIAPLAWLAAKSAEAAGRRSGGWLSAAVLMLAAGGAAWNDVGIWRMLQADLHYWNRHGVDLRLLPGATDVVQESDPLNQVLPSDGLVWLIGDARPLYLRMPVHYTVVFDRDPWLEYARQATPTEAVGWLRTHGVTHVVFSWAEIARLRRTYGFTDLVTPTWVASLVPAGLDRLAAPDLEPDVAVYAVR